MTARRPREADRRRARARVGRTERDRGRLLRHRGLHRHDRPERGAGRRGGAARRRRTDRRFLLAACPAIMETVGAEERAVKIDWLRLLGGARVILLALTLGSLTATVTAAASPIRQLTTTPSASNLRPTWSPDGKRVAYQSDKDGSFHIYVMNADGTDTKQISSGKDIDDRHPAWSPDGNAVAVDSGDATHREIWIIDIASQRRTQVTKTGAIATFPSWSPDGKRLAFYVYTASLPATSGPFTGSMDVYTASRDGSGVVQMTKGLASEQNSQCT